MVHIPNLAVLVCANSSDHVTDMGVETGSRASFRVCLDTENRLCKLASVEANEVTTLRSQDQIVLHRWVPLNTLNIFIKRLIQLMSQ